MVAEVAAPISSNAAVEARSCCSAAGVSPASSSIWAPTNDWLARLKRRPNSSYVAAASRNRRRASSKSPAHREQPGEARVDRASQRRVEPELVPQILDSGDRLVDRSRPVQQRLRRQAGQRSDHLGPGPGPACVLESMLDRFATRAPAARGEVAGAPQPPGAGERELVAERLEFR